MIQLQSRSVVTAQEIADKFEISVRTVYRDIRSLEAAGVPIAAEAGIGYSLVNGYQLPPVQFTLSEATAFLTAEKLIEKLTDEGIHEGFQSGITKIKSILRDSEKEHLETIEHQIVVRENRYTPKTNGNERFMQQIIQCISNKLMAEITYLSGVKVELSTRKLEPIGMFFASSRWYFVAYCHLRKAYRQFRLDRIKTFRISSEVFQHKHPSLNTFLQEVAEERELHHVVLEIDNHQAKFLGDQKYYNGYIRSEQGETTTRMEFLTPHMEGMARWFLMMSDKSKVISPPELKTRITEIVAEIQKNIRS